MIADLADILKKEGLENLEEFVKANIQILPEEAQRLFNALFG